MSRKTPEGRYKEKLKKWLDDNRILHYPNVVGLGHTSGRADYTLCINGMYIDIECKTNTGKLSAAQKVEQQRVVSAGGLFLISSPDTFEKDTQFLFSLKEKGRAVYL